MEDNQDDQSLMKNLWAQAASPYVRQRAWKRVPKEQIYSLTRAFHVLLTRTLRRKDFPAANRYRSHLAFMYQVNGRFERALDYLRQIFTSQVMELDAEDKKHLNFNILETELLWHLERGTFLDLIKIGVSRYSEEFLRKLQLKADGIYFTYKDHKEASKLYECLFYIHVERKNFIEACNAAEVLALYSTKDHNYKKAYLYLQTAMAIAVKNQSPALAEQIEKKRTVMLSRMIDFLSDAADKGVVHCIAGKIPIGEPNFVLFLKNFAVSHFRSGDIDKYVKIITVIRDLINAGFASLDVVILTLDMAEKFLSAGEQFWTDEILNWFNFSIERNISRKGIALALNIKGFAAQKKEDYHRAFFLLKRCFKLSAGMKKEERLNYLSHLGGILIQGGKIEKGLSYCRNVERFISKNEWEIRFNNFLNMGRAYIYQKNHKKAEELTQKAEEILDNITPGRAEKMWVVRQYVALYLSDENIILARRNAEKLVNLAELNKNDSEKIYALYALGSCLFREEKWKEAMVYFKKVLNLSETTPVNTLAETSLEASISCFHLEDLTEAKNLSLQAANLFFKYEDFKSGCMALAISLQACVALGEVENSISILRSIFDYAERSSGVPLDAFRQPPSPRQFSPVFIQVGRFLLKKSVVGPGLMAAELGRWRTGLAKLAKKSVSAQVHMPADFSAIVKSIDEPELRLMSRESVQITRKKTVKPKKNRFLNYLDDIYPSASAARLVAPLSESGIENLVKIFESQMARIVYYQWVEADRLKIVVLQTPLSKSLEFEVTLDPKLIIGYHKCLFSRSLPDEMQEPFRRQNIVPGSPDFEHLLRMFLSKKLLYKILEETDPLYTLYMIPDGVLHWLPFGTLLDNNGAYFFEGRNCLTAPSLAILNTLVHRYPPSTEQSLIVAVSDFGGASTLDGVKQEYENIEVFFNETVDMSHSDVSALVEACRNKRNIHFASHAGITGLLKPSDFEKEKRGESFIYFGHGKTLSSRQIVEEMDIESELVFLNCCNTGWSTKVNEFSEQNSLAEAFLITGASSVVHTLWAVEDISASIISEYFYKSVFQHGKKRSQALRNAVYHLWEQNDKYRAPEFWGQYQLLGIDG